MRLSMKQEAPSVREGWLTEKLFSRNLFGSSNLVFDAGMGLLLQRSTGRGQKTPLVGCPPVNRYRRATALYLLPANARQRVTLQSIASGF
jgi:hypothetical protein